MNYIDLFAGAGGLSEGFKKAGFNPIAHIEAEKAACFTLKTRLCFYYLEENQKLEIYYSYLKGEISRKELYSHIPDNILNTVINEKISPETNEDIFEKIDIIKGEQEIDLIVGGPPCQAYSTMGRGALKHKKGDIRKELYKEYGKYLQRYGPKLFVFENVPGLKTSDYGIHYRNLQEYFVSIGYSIDERQLNAWDFGVIQRRERLIIIGWREDVDFAFPDFELTSNPWTRDHIFSDLPALKPGNGTRWCEYSKPANSYLKDTAIRNGVNFITQHIARPHNDKDLLIYNIAIKQLGDGHRLKNNELDEEIRTQSNTTDFVDRFKVVDLVPHTMIAHISKDGHHFIHPDQIQLRSITVREAARIQSFPDNFYFEGVKDGIYRSPAFTQIGNAVPPLMAEKLANKIKTLLDGR